jgi:hypothetical protein
VLSFVVPALSFSVPSLSFVSTLHIFVVVIVFFLPSVGPSLVVSTSIAPYEQSLAGGVVVLSDVAPVVVQEQDHPASRGSQRWHRVGGGSLG